MRTEHAFTSRARQKNQGIPAKIGHRKRKQMYLPYCKEFLKHKEERSKVLSLSVYRYHYFEYSIFPEWMNHDIQ